MLRNDPFILICLCIALGMGIPAFMISSPGLMWGAGALVLFAASKVLRNILLERRNAWLAPAGACINIFGDTMVLVGTVTMRIEVLVVGIAFALFGLGLIIK